MGFRYNKIIKYFILFIFLIFNVNGISISTSNNLKYKEKAIKIKKNKGSVIPKYAPEITKDVSKKLDSVLKRIHKRNDFNGSVLVAKNGKVIFNDHYGYADFRNKTRLNDHSIYQLASVSKQFTAVSILILYEQKKLALEDKVITYFPEFPYEDITIQQLLNHTSGLPKYFWIAEHKWDKQNAPENADMMAMIAEHQLPLFFKPGSRFDYSNTGYFVLAALVEKITGENYGDFVRSHIFEPLDMSNSFVYRYQQDPVNENQLTGYRLYRRWRHAKISATVNDAITGDKNVYSTTEDLFKWINGLNSGKIISKNTLDQMYTKGKTKYGREVPYGFGFRIQDKNSEKVIYHHGKWNGFSTSLKQYTDDDLVIITLEHSNYNALNYLNDKVKSLVNNHFDPGALPN